nr:hypothetical protein [Rhodoferax sp.]
MLTSMSFRPARKGGLHTGQVVLLSLVNEVRPATDGVGVPGKEIAIGDQDLSMPTLDTATALQPAWWHFLPPCG